jgi:hypothetical protein
MGKINKELTFDYQGTDRMVKDEIRRCEDMCIQLTNTHVTERKSSDARMSKFIDEKCFVLRDLIERELKERTTSGRNI